mgnify:CR=1 FL=1
MYPSERVRCECRRDYRSAADVIDVETRGENLRSKSLSGCERHPKMPETKLSVAIISVDDILEMSSRDNFLCR